MFGCFMRSLHQEKCGTLKFVVFSGVIIVLEAEYLFTILIALITTIVKYMIANKPFKKERI